MLPNVWATGGELALHQKERKKSGLSCSSIWGPLLPLKKKTCWKIHLCSALGRQWSNTFKNTYWPWKSIESTSIVISRKTNWYLITKSPKSCICQKIQEPFLKNYISRFSRPFVSDTWEPLSVLFKPFLYCLTGNRCWKCRARLPSSNNTRGGHYIYLQHSNRSQPNQAKPSRQLLYGAQLGFFQLCTH